MTKQQALKAMEEATNEMARMTEGSELYKAAKAKHVAAKGALIAIMTADEVENAESQNEVLEAELSEIVETVEVRNQELIADAGFYTNSVIGGIASGSISTQTPEETQRIYELKQALMSIGPFLQQAARQRNLARRAARQRNRSAH
ncbi:hypothetical protein SIPHO076v1_p0075 [Vibrio phage PS34B.1]|nr:hypothetical protein SIPHO076v1_p0075 [Vibrio phage PS34B.1]